VMGMNKVKPGDTVVIRGKEFIFDKSSSKTFNDLLELSQEGVEVEDMTIHMIYAGAKLRAGLIISFSDIKEALERAEFNKSRHGL